MKKCNIVFEVAKCWLPPRILLITGTCWPWLTLILKEERKQYFIVTELYRRRHQAEQTAYPFAALSSTRVKNMELQEVNQTRMLFQSKPLSKFLFFLISCDMHRSCFETIVLRTTKETWTTITYTSKRTHEQQLTLWSTDGLSKALQDCCFKHPMKGLITIHISKPLERSSK